MKRLLLKIHNKIIYLFFQLTSLFYQKGISIYMLHNISDTKKDLYTVTPKELKRFVDWLKNKAVISIDELYEKLVTKEFHNEIVLTFDDVYSSVYEIAYPLLKKNNIPFTLFVNLELLATDNYISSEQLIEMAHNKACTIGSHGLNHVRFRNLSKENTKMQLAESKTLLENKTHKSIDYFAFPYGSIAACSLRKIWQARKVGYKLNFVTIPVRASKNPLIRRWIMPRINVTSNFISKL
jgi:peptidoglycan/xylan/chitin deacetylase (PgdA/CDA1 family)